MTFDPAVHHRRSIRLQRYDYSCAGAYFVTICTQNCTQNRECLFGERVDGAMRLNDVGKVVEQCWHEIPTHFPQVELDEFVVMPNHVHGILVIGDFGVAAEDRANDDSPLRKRPSGTSRTIGSVVRGFKIGVTKWMRQTHPIPEVWQRNYWEHIIRDEAELAHIRAYICDNPARWELDQLHPDGSILSGE